MRNFLKLMTVVLLTGACAHTTNTVTKERDPKTGELVTVKEEHTDQHKYMDPFGHGQKDAADAQATKVMAEACLESLKAQQANVAFGIPFQCGTGYITHGANGMSFTPYGGGSPYMMPGAMPYGGGSMYPTPYGTMMPMSSVMPGQPQVMSTYAMSFTPPAMEANIIPNDASRANGQENGKAEKKVQKELTYDEQQLLEQLFQTMRLCNSDPKAPAEKCRDARAAYEHQKFAFDALLKARNNGFPSVASNAPIGKTSTPVAGKNAVGGNAADVTIADPDVTPVKRD